MQRFAKKIYLTLFLILLFSLNSFADTYPKREMRAAWIATVWNLDWPKTDAGVAYQGTTSEHRDNQKTYLRNMIQKLKDSGFNAVNFQVRGFCDAMYKSSYEPWSVALTEKRGTAPYGNWDPLEYCIEVCHEFGMECHAWVNPFRFSTGTTLPSTANDMTLRNNGWILTYGTTSVLNPAIEDARNYIVESICKEIVQKYDIDGMVWDDYFYPNGIPSTSEAQDYTNYQSYKNAGGTMSIGDWRRNNVNTTVKMAFDMIQREKPYVKFGISPAGVANEGARAHGIEPAKISSNGYQYNGIFADPCAWIIDGYIDYVSPQLYWLRSHGSAPFDPLCEWWNSVAATHGVQCYISHDIAGSTSTWSNTSSDYTERYNQILQVRATSVDFNAGQVFYSAGYLNGPNTTGFGQYLKENVYQYPAIPPKIVRDNEHQLLVNPGKVSNLALNSTTLSWTAVNSSTKHRYAVYAIPLSIGVSDASSSIHTDDGGFKAEYLIDVTFNSSLSGVPTGSYWYAVTAIDRYGYEWEAAALNAPKLGDVSLALDTPTSGVTLPFGDNSFSWTSDGTSFLFQISTSEDFNRPLIEEELTNKSYTLNITPEVFEDGGTYYWHVVASKDNYNSAWSEVRSFTIEPRPFIPLTLLSPENNSTIDSDKITFEWEGIEGATYTFEIAEYSSFNTILRTATLTNTNYSLDKSSFTGGKTYFWRVKAVKDGYQPSISDQASFKTPKVEGELVDGISIENLWIKSVSTNNFPTQLANCVSARTMAEYNGNLYILERANDTECYLLEFDGKTCEFLKQIPLTGDIYTYSGGTISSWDHKAGQCIFSDDTGNLYISSLAVASELRPITVCSVDVTTGVTSKIFEANKTAVRHRIDYANATGNLNTEGGKIWAATSDNTIYRWTRKSDGSWTEETTTINDYHPNIVTALGTAPYIQPISTTQFIVDGAGTHPALYTFNSGSTATLNSSFADNAAIEPTKAGSNGTCSITIGNTPLFVYVDDNHNGNGHSFSIVANKHNFDFSQFQFMKSVPENKLGKLQHDYALDQPVAIKNDDGSATIFLYAPKNGLAAYRISLPVIEISLDSPADNTVFEEDFDFSWNGVEGASYTLEISKTSTFEKIEYTATTTATSYSSSNFNFASETLYFWRVKASHPNYTANSSEVRQFTSPVSQSAIDNLTITELWNKSVNNNSLPSQINSKAQRSIAAYNGNVYVITNTSGELLEFSGITGAYNRTITLKGDCFTNSSNTKLGIPTNCIFVDGNNNLCVSNLVTSFSTDNPLTVCTIDVNTGNTTRVFQSNITESIRVDYANAFGDVTKDGAQIWVSTNATKVLRWTRKNGSWVYESTTISSFYPTSATSLGTAPWIMPISETDFLVDGAGNAPTRYTFKASGNATYVSGFDSNKPLAPSYTTTGKAYGAGMGQITLGKYPLFIYNNDNQNGNGHNYNIVHNPSSYDFSQMEKLWTVPENYLGKETHSSILNPVACLKNTDNSATVFVYAPMNGLAAYRISLPEMNLLLTSPANNETVEKGFDFTWKGVAGSEYTLEVSTTSDFKNIAFSTTTSDATYSSTNFKLAPATKYYWRVIGKNNNFTTTTSSVGQFTTETLPMLPITLTYPIDNVQTEQGFYFTWKGVEESIYKIEISTSETFDNIAFTTTTTDVSFNSVNINFAPKAQYYWRVIATNENYSTTTSAVAQFISPEKPTMTPPQLYIPYNWENLSSDISFVAKYSYLIIDGEKKYTTKTTLEIYTDENLTNLFYSGDSEEKWKEEFDEKGESWLQYTLPISLFANGTYYWRVIAESIDPELEDGISEVRQFTVDGQYDESVDYKMVREKSSYPEFPINGQYVSLYNNWIRSTTYGNEISQANNGKYARGFCVRPDQNGDQNGMDIIYIPNDNSSNANLDYYNAANGEFLGTLTVTANAGTTIATSTIPCNGLFVDNAGNLCFYNLAEANKALQICTVDLDLTDKTAIATERFNYTVVGRIDHCRAYGDVANKNFILYGGVSTTNSIYKWEVNNNVTFEDKSFSSITGTYGFGYNIMAFPVNNNLVYIDGSTSNLYLIDFENGKVKSQFTQSNTALTGGGFFIHNNINNFMVYPNIGGKTSHQYNITSIENIDEGNSNSTLRWAIPSDENALPAHTLTTYGALVDYLPKNNLTKSANLSSNSTIVYLYVPGSGLASYTISSHIVTGAEEVTDENIKISVNAQKITFGCEVDNAQIYTLSGLLINNAEKASSIEKPAVKGVYILQLTVNGTSSTHKIVL